VWLKFPVRTDKAVPNQGKEEDMAILRDFALFAAVAAFATAPAIAGEITGNDRYIDVHGKSSCAYSGQNDTPDGDEATSDPGGRVQTYGYFQSQTWLGDFINPRVVGPRSFSPHPGYACNPTSDPAFPIG
jgi:hypothetical protein